MRRIERKAPFEALRMWRRDDVVATRAGAGRGPQGRDAAAVVLVQLAAVVRPKTPSRTTAPTRGRDDGQIEELMNRDDEGVLRRRIFEGACPRRSPARCLITGATSRRCV